MLFLLGMIVLFVLVTYSVSKKEVLTKRKKELEEETKTLQREIENLNLIIRKTTEREGISQTVKGLLDEVTLKENKVKELNARIEELNKKSKKKLDELSQEISEKKQRIKFLTDDLEALEKQDFILYSGSYVGDEY
ncbi:MAG: coiled-coil domain-containing protein, partial [Cetobacterium sp.]